MTIEDSPRLRADLAACLAVPRFAEDVAAAAPFPSASDLHYAAAVVAATLTAEEVDLALADHPRIGERHAGSGASSEFSRREQASVDADDAEVNAQIAVGNAAYEERFDRVFLIRAAGRSRAEILAELTRRLALSPEEEAPIVAGELAQIALLRLAALYPAEADDHSGPEPAGSAPTDPTTEESR